MMRHVASHMLGAGLALIVGATAIALPSDSFAASAAPHWVTITQSAPTSFHPGDTSDFYEVIAVNDGGVPTSGPITVTDTLPAGIVVNNTPNAYAEIAGIFDGQSEAFTSGCEQLSIGGAVRVTCITFSSVPVGRSLVVNINVQVPEGLAGSLPLVNSATVSGGGAQDASEESSTSITEAATPVPFGADIEGEATSANGKIDTQAGSHPFAFTTLLAFNVASVNPFEQCNEGTTPSCAALNAQAKDLEVALPPGLVGNPTAVPYCTQAEFEQNTFYGCPAASQVGGLYLYFYGKGTSVQYAPVYNIKPPPGQPAELGFTVSTQAHIPMYFHVRSDGNYGVTADLANINQFDPVRIALLSIWGNPSDAAHNPLRLSIFGNCGNGEGGCPSGVSAPKPFLSMPTQCTEDPLGVTASGDSWQSPGAAPFPLLTSTAIAGMSGCEALRFHPSMSVAASSHEASAPAGYDIDVTVPQNEELEGLATPNLRDIEVALPEGITLSPSAANGLVACSDEQFGLKIRAKGHCPSASRIGSAIITTPLLANQVVGSVYVGEPECSPCSPADAASGRMGRVLIEAEAAGVVIKQAGHTEINQSTGRLTTVFTNAPQLPFSDLQVSLESGSGAPLVNPSTCGPAIASAQITPWSSAVATNVEAQAIPIEDCGAPGFSPGFQAGTVPTAHAGAFSGFTMTLSRGDHEQTFGHVSVTTPQGLLGVLKNVDQCPEPQANAGTCSAASLIGTGSVVAGPGSTPLTIGGAKVYMTGPYHGNPFGLSIVTPTVAGPFVLAGNVGNGSEVVRASIAVNPRTGALTVTSDPLPQQLDGVPLDIRTIHIDIDREKFIFNPTNCDTMSVLAAVTSATGTVANISTPFQAVDCGILPFKPKFTVITRGKTSKKNGASLHVKVASGAGQANIAKVKVNLPILLPSRLSTLQKACVDSVFDANPAFCPAVSVVGQATAVTPLLKSHLTGPAFLVSHAGAAFPDLEIVLQGEGITLILDGNTKIKNGITSSTFKAVPDAPINSFDLSLPEGPHSVLAAFGNLCTNKLNLPTVITGQNGAVVKQTTRIIATGCPKHKKTKAKHAASSKH